MIILAFIGLYAASNYRYWVFRSGNEYLKNCKYIKGYFHKHANWYDEFMKYINQAIIETSLILAVVGCGIMFIKILNDTNIEVTSIVKFHLQRMKSSGLLQILIIFASGIIIRIITVIFKNNRIIRKDNLNKFLTIHLLLLVIPFCIVDGNLAFLILAIVAGKIIWFGFSLEKVNMAKISKMLFYIMFRNNYDCGPEDYFIYNSGRIVFKYYVLLYFGVLFWRFICIKYLKT